MGNNKSQGIIKTLQENDFHCECPNCNEEIPLKNTNLFDNSNFTEDAEKIYLAQLELIKNRKRDLKNLRDIGTSKSIKATRAINLGFIFERIAPTMESFRFNHNDCRSLFDPIDYIIFDGLSKNGKVQKIFFVDIKTGASILSKRQIAIKEVIMNNQVNFKIY